MIDIHTHILPGVDDGPQTIEESLKIVNKASHAGIKTIVATPHILETPTESICKKISSAFLNLKQILISEGVDVEIILGAELFISPEIPRKIREHRELTINNGNKYVLLELPVHEIPFFTEQTIFELLVMGIVPIIAHPERHFEIQNDTTKLSVLAEKGVISQINSGSLVGRYGRKVQKTSIRLLSNNLTQMIASDIHSIPNRDYPLMEAVNAAADVIGIERALEMVTSIPERIIGGEEISAFLNINEK